MISKELLTFCKEFKEWPESWEIDTLDIETGKIILHDVFIPFFEHLVSSGLPKKP